MCKCCLLKIEIIQEGAYQIHSFVSQVLCEIYSVTFVKVIYDHHIVLSMFSDIFREISFLNPIYLLIPRAVHQSNFIHRLNGNRSCYVVLCCVMLKLCCCALVFFECEQNYIWCLTKAFCGQVTKQRLLQVEDTEIT